MAVGRDSMKIEHETMLDDVPSKDPADDEDYLNQSFPNKPSELRQLTNDELFRAWRRLLYSSGASHDRMVEHELTTRLIVALGDFKKSSDRAAKAIIGLTFVLVALTVVLVWLTLRL